MADSINIQVLITDRLTPKLDEVRSRINSALSAVGAMVVGRAVEKLSGDVLNARTGTLRNSVNFVVGADGPDTQWVQVGTRGLPYAAIHEYGGTIRVPEIRPVSARVLHWVSPTGDDVFAAFARAHDIVMPERSYMRSSLTELAPDIRVRITAALEGLGA